MSTEDPKDRSTTPGDFTESTEREPSNVDHEKKPALDDMPPPPVDPKESDSFSGEEGPTGELMEQGEEIPLDLTEETLDEEIKPEARPTPPPGPPRAPPPPPPPPSGAGAREATVELPPYKPIERTDVVGEALEGAGHRDWASQIHRLDAEMDGESRKAVLALLKYEIGEIQERRLADEAGAIKSYGEALKLHMALLSNLWAIRRMLLKRKKWPNLIKLVEGELKLVTDPKYQADLLLEKGEILEAQLDDLEGAKACYLQVLDIVPDSMEAMLKLEKLLLFQGSFDELTDIMRRHADIAGSAGRKSAILQGMARLLSHMGAPYEKRKELLDESVSLEQNLENLLWDLERQTLQEGRYDHFIEVLARRGDYLVAQEKETEALAVRRRQARATLRYAKDVNRAFQILADQLARTPDDPLLLVDMTVLGWQAGRFEDLTEILVRRLSMDGAVPREDVLDLKFQLALAYSLSSKPEKAAEVLAELLPGEGTGFPDALVLKERELLSKQDLMGLQELMEGEERLLASPEWPQSNEETLPCRARMAAFRALLLATEAERLQRAAHPGRGEEGSESAFGNESPESRELMERAVVVCRQALEMDSTVGSAIQLLEELLGRLGRWAELVRWQEERAAKVDPVEASRILESLVDLHLLREKRPEAAVRALERLSELKPDDTLIKLRLEAELEQMGRWEEACSVLSKLADESLDPNKQAEHLVRAAEIDYFNAKNTDAAVRHLKAALRQAPENHTAAALLELVLDKEGRWEDLQSLLRDEVERTLDEGEIERLLCRLGEVLEIRMGKLEEAEVVYQDLLERFPKNSSAIRALSRVYRSSGQSKKLVEVMEHQADALDDPLQRSDLLFEIGEILDHEVADEESAKEAAVKAFSLNPQNRTSLESVLRYFQSSKEWSKISEILTEHLQATAESDRNEAGAEEDADRIEAAAQSRLELLEELAWVLEAGLVDPATARPHWEDLSKAEGPTRRRALWALVRQSVRDGEVGEQSDWELMLSKDLEGPWSRVTALRAALHAAFGGKDPTEIFRELLEGPNDAAWKVAGWLARLPSDQASSTLAGKAAKAEGEAKGWMLAAQALVLERMGLNEESDRIWRKAMENRPVNLGSLLSLLSVAEKAEDERAVASLRLMAGEMLSDSREGGRMLLSGGMLAEKIGDKELAKKAYRQVLARVPDDADGFGRLKDLLTAGSDWADLDRLYAHRISICDDKKELVELRLERAELCASRLNNVAEAASQLHRVIRVKPDEARASFRLGRLYAEDGDGTTACELLKKAVVDSSDPSLRQKARFSLAEVYEVLFEDAEAALGVLAEAGEEPSEDEKEPLERMLSFRVRQRQWEEAEQLLDRLMELADERQERAHLELRKAALYQEGLAEEQKAKECLEQARTLDPLNMDSVRKLAEIHKGVKDKLSLEQLFLSSSQAQMEVLVKTPTEPKAMRNLADIQEMAGQEERRFFATSAYALVSDLSQERRRWLDKTSKKKVAATKLSLSDEDWLDRLVHPDARLPAWDLWQLMAGAASRIHCADLASMGVTKADRVSGKNEGALFGEVLLFADLLGIKLAGVYRWKSKERAFKACPTVDGPVMLVSDSLGTSSLDSKTRFELGWELGACKAGALPLLAIPSDKAHLLFAAAVIETIPDYAHGLSTEEVESTSKTLKKAMSRKERKGVPPAAMSFARVPFDLDRWLDGMRRTFERIGLFVCGDVQTAVLAVLEKKKKAWDVLDASARRELIDKSVKARQLILFAVSEAFSAVRKNLGVARS